MVPGTGPGERVDSGGSRGALSGGDTNIKIIRMDFNLITISAQLQ